MKSSFFNRTIAVVLSFLVLFSTLSLAIEKHFCGDTLVDVAIFTKAKKCGEEMQGMNQSEITKKSCCKDETQIIKGQDELKTNSFDDLPSIQKQILVAFQFSYINLFESLPKETIPNRDYSPPEIVKDIHVLDETYLI
ncbi:HYC_CC_PP family protein [Winogradskyella sp. HB-48]|uniref:HYC_CC_PP family protein n=1 Tax=Winogradskyella sp. HB-48 TaxID=3416808 RepID=UPI003CF8B7F4